MVAATAELGNRFDRQLGQPMSAPVTLDMDGTLSEVYGRQKELASFNHEGRRGFLSVFVTWDERRRILVADLLKGSASEKPGAAGLLPCGRSGRCRKTTVRSRFESTPASTRSSCWRPAGAARSSSASR